MKLPQFSRPRSILMRIYSIQYYKRMFDEALKWYPRPYFLLGIKVYSWFRVSLSFISSQARWPRELKDRFIWQEMELRHDFLYYSSYFRLSQTWFITLRVRCWYPDWSRAAFPFLLNIQFLDEIKRISNK